MAFRIEAQVGGHTLSTTGQTMKQAMAKAVDWHVVERFSDVVITYGDNRFTIEEFGSWMGEDHSMKKTKASNDELIWMIHERLKEFHDHPQQAVIPIAIVPRSGGDWSALMSNRRQSRREVWAGRIAAIERDLRKSFALRG
jgi:hypothetical protein